MMSWWCHRDVPSGLGWGGVGVEGCQVAERPSGVLATRHGFSPDSDTPWTPHPLRADTPPSLPSPLPTPNSSCSPWICANLIPMPCRGVVPVDQVQALPAPSFLQYPAGPEVRAWPQCPLQVGCRELWQWPWRWEGVGRAGGASSSRVGPPWSYRWHNVTNFLRAAVGEIESARRKKGLPVVPAGMALDGRPRRRTGLPIQMYSGEARGSAVLKGLLMPGFQWEGRLLQHKGWAGRTGVGRPRPGGQPPPDWRWSSGLELAWTDSERLLLWKVFWPASIQTAQPGPRPAPFVTGLWEGVTLPTVGSSPLKLFRRLHLFVDSHWCKDHFQSALKPSYPQYFFNTFAV